MGKIATTRPVVALCRAYIWLFIAACTFCAIVGVMAGLRLFNGFCALGVTPDSVLARADRHLRAYRFDEAIADCNRAIQMDPQFMPSHVLRGEIHEAKGDYEYAIQDYTTVAVANPWDFSIFVMRGRVYEQLGRMDRALADYTTAVLRSPASARAATSLALTRVHSDRESDANRALDEMVGIFTTALARDPNNQSLVRCHDFFERAICAQGTR